MKHNSISRYDMLTEITKGVDVNTIRKSKVVTHKSLVSRSLWVGEKLCVMLEQARRTVGYQVFSKSQLKEAEKYIAAFLGENKILNGQGEGK